MRRPLGVSAIVLVLCFSFIAGQQVTAQGYDVPLTVQGLNQKVLQSAASRGAGGVTLGVKGDISLMFTNPALLQSVDRLSVSIGAVQARTKTYQDQRYGGLQNHSGFNLLVEGVTDWISDPDSISGTPSAGDSVQRPFDSIGPDWNRSKSKTIPMQAFAAMPFMIEDVPFVVGVGAIQYANLDRYYANNNCFSPSVLSVLNGTISTIPLAANPYLTQWYQYAQEREGAIYGYGAAFSASPLDRLTLGLSGIILSGSSDDREVRVGRGRMAFYNNYLRLSKEGMTSFVKTGTSDYKGFELTAAGTYSGKNFTVGFSVKPPSTITRTYASSMTGDSVTSVSLLNHRVDSLHAVLSGSVSGEDKMKFPWRGTAGVSLNVKENLTVGLELELRSYGLATYVNAAGAETKPWVSAALWHVGAEYRPAEWLAIRGGAREDAEVYEPVSNAIRGEAVRYTVYTFGFGLKYAGAQLNVAYEYGDMKYIDTWSNAASINREFRSAVAADISYALPW